MNWYKWMEIYIYMLKERKKNKYDIGLIDWLIDNNNIINTKINKEKKKEKKKKRHWKSHPFLK